MRFSIAMTPGGMPPRRTAACVVTSVALHVLAILSFAGLGLRTPQHEDRTLVTLAKVAAPPPPAVLNDIPGLQTSAPDWWDRAEPVPKVRPKPVVKPKPKQAIRAERPPQAKKPDPQPVAAPEPPAAVANAAVGPPAGGAPGGVAGGSPGGRAGGILGGTGDTVLRVDQVASPPRLIDRVLPRYPSQARAHRLEGIVVLEAVVDRRGHVETEGLQVVQSQEPFDQAALDAFLRWRFEPARDGTGNPVRVLVRQAIRFELR